MGHYNIYYYAILIIWTIIAYLDKCRTLMYITGKSYHTRKGTQRKQNDYS